MGWQSLRVRRHLLHRENCRPVAVGPFFGLAANYFGYFASSHGISQTLPQHLLVLLDLFLHRTKLLKFPLKVGNFGRCKIGWKISSFMYKEMFIHMWWKCSSFTVWLIAPDVHRGTCSTVNINIKKSLPTSRPTSFSHQLICTQGQIMIILLWSSFSDH